MAEMSIVREEKLKEVFTCIDRAGDAGATVLDVATCLNMKVTPYLREMLDQLVSFGWVRQEQSIIRTSRGARMGWRYFVIAEQ